jgi:Fe-S-cluster containining protein
MDRELPPTMQVNFTLKLGEGTMKAATEVPSRQMTLTELMPVLQTVTSQIVGGVSKAASERGYEVSCRAGCGACCRQLVPISIFEAEALAEWIRSLPPEQQEQLQARFHRALLELRDKGLLERLNPELWVEGSESAKTLGIDYHLARVACPFLEEESCSIHPIRPLVCREYVVTSPPEFCVEPSSDRVQGLMLPVQPSKALIQIGKRLENDANGWIPLVLLFQWMKSGAEPGKRVAGPGPAVLNEVLQAMLA